MKDVRWYEYLNAWIEWGFFRVLKGRDIKVLMTIVKHYDFDRKHICKPAIKTISKYTGLSNGAIIKSLKALSKAGVLKIEKKIGIKRKVGFRYNTYELITPDKLEDKLILLYDKDNKGKELSRLKKQLVDVKRPLVSDGRNTSRTDGRKASM